MNLQLLSLENDIKFNSFESLFTKSIEALAGKPLKNGKLDYHKQEFLKQYVSHYISIRTLCTTGLRLTYKGQENEISALSSALVLIRACLENYSMFYYIYRDSMEYEDTYFRFWSWFREGLMHRQRMSVDGHEEALHDDKTEIQRIFTELSQKPIHDLLTPKQKKRYLKTGAWCPGKAELLKISGFPETLSNNLYNYFSSHTHPSSTSQLQTSQADFDRSNRTLDYMLNTLFICSGFYLHHYLNTFEDIGKLMNEKDIDLIESWRDLASS